MHRMIQTKNPLKYDVRNTVAESLEELTYALLDIAGQAKVAHWNVTGPFFSVLHKTFGKLAGELDGYADLTAERGVQLGAVIFATPRVVAKESAVPELPESGFEGAALLKEFVRRVAALSTAVYAAIELSEDLDDCITANMLTEINTGVEKWLWMLEKQV